MSDAGPGDAGTVTAARPGRWRGYLALAVFYLVLLAGAEWAAGRLYPRLAPENGRKAVDTLLRPAAAEASGFFVKHPYLFYAFRPGYEAFGRVQFNSRGHRNPETDPQPAPGVLRILCTGGSTTASFPYVRKPEEAWPLRLGAILSERTGRRVEVINAGLHGATSAEMLAHYQFRNRYLGAQIVLMEVGGNDGLALNYPDYSPEYTNFTHGWKSGALVRRPGEGLLLRSDLVKWLYAVWFRNLSLESQIGRDSIKAYSPEACLENARRNEPEGFRRNVDLLVTMARADGATPVLFAFAWAPDEKWRAMRDYGRYRDSMVLGFTKSVAAAKTIAERSGVAWLELPAGALPASVFIDFCHLTADGEEIKARFLAERLLPVASAFFAGKAAGGSVAGRPGTPEAR
jgi:lysophospholipase L1-like esterase